ncbi:Uncharacterised protein [Burkholderia pseudomallei]|nr:Uncharacterised protein [Burkholderia pseudomallei]
MLGNCIGDLVPGDILLTGHLDKLYAGLELLTLHVLGAFHMSQRGHCRLFIELGRSGWIPDVTILSSHGRTPCR